MKNPFTIDISKIRRKLIIRKPAFTTHIQISKRDLAIWLYYIAIIIAFFASLNPWFLWSIYHFYPALVFCPIVLSLLISRKLDQPIFNAKGWQYASITYCVYIFMTVMVNGRNLNGYILQAFNATIFISLFLLNKDLLIRMGTILAKIMGGILVVSLGFYVLYLCHYPLFHYAISNTEFDYSYQSYIFFLIDDRYSTLQIPRFHSVFLEPSHLAMTCVPLLLTQVGNWKKWWNIVLIVATLVSFSLAGYIFLVFILFAIAWIKKKAILGKLLLLTTIVILFLAASTIYKDGNNMVNQLILQRMTLNDDGKLSGDNRVSDSFTAEYKKLTHSSSILWGKGAEDMQRFGFGNAGYRVYIYSNGIICLALLIVFLCCVVHSSPYKRQCVVFLLFQFLSFIPHAVPTKYSMFIPLYIMLFLPIDGCSQENSH